MPSRRPNPGAETKKVQISSRNIGSCSRAASDSIALAPSSGIAACASSGAESNALDNAINMHFPAASSIGRAKPGSEARTKSALAASSLSSACLNIAFVDLSNSTVSSLASLSVDRFFHGAAKFSTCAIVFFACALSPPFALVAVDGSAACILISSAVTRA